MLVQGANTSALLSITPMPFASAHHFIDGRPCALIFISDPKAKPASREALLRSLFGLTPAESRLAQLLLDGMDLSVASEHLRLTAATERFMLKQIFSKTGCHRQSQLIRLLSLLPGEREMLKP